MTLTEFDVWFRSRYRRTSSAFTTTSFILSDLTGVMLSFGWGFFCVKMIGWISLDARGIINFKSFVTY